MDAKKLGRFIAERRKELDMTQNTLAQKLHVTDKAVSRWERGVGLPDIQNLEPLAEILEVGLVELMQAQRNEKEEISTREAEKLLSDTISMSNAAGRAARWIGFSILFCFAAVAALLLGVWITDGAMVRNSVASIVLGLLAWGLPIWNMTLARKKRAAAAASFSWGLAFLSLVFQFLDIARTVHNGDWSSLMDTADALVIVVVLFGGVTLLLNVLSVWFSRKKEMP